MRKLMILGGSYYAIPVIDKAHELGLYVITCDYLPDNEAHRHSDEYCNVSVVDKEAVLDAARRLKIDGIISFACDPGVVSAAYVAEKMGLPFQGPYESVRILQDKGLFKKFLADNGFNTPAYKRYDDRNEPLNDIGMFRWPVIVKPADSAGSKGVTRVDRPEDLKAAIDTALVGSIHGGFIIEEYLEFDGFHSDTDALTVDGRLKFITYNDELFDAEAMNPYTPWYTVWPGTLKEEYRKSLTEQTQRLMDLLHMRSGIYNIETCGATDGKAYIMEVSPRGGGGMLTTVTELTMGVPLIENEIRSAMGMPLTDYEEHEIDGVWCEMIVHADKDQSGVLQKITIDDDIRRNNLKFEKYFVKPGDAVKPFSGANMSLGILFLRFDTRKQLDEAVRAHRDWLHIELS